MATSQQFLVCDSSTLANFKSWAQAISNFFATAGWVQTADTGQVNWASIGAVPGSGAFVYEVWKPGDAFPVFYVKVEYGNFSGTNCPSLRLSMATSTNGAGTLTGFVTTVINVDGTVFTAPSTSTTFECNFSGANNRIAVMMWRNGTNSCQQLFAIERSLDSSGAYTGTYATLFTCGNHGTGNCAQQSLVFALGAAPYLTNNGIAGGNGGWAVRGPKGAAAASTVFGGSIPFDTPAPSIGYFDYASTSVGVAMGVDIAEGVTFTVTLYGATRTFMPSKTGPFGAFVGPANATGMCIAMRYD